MAEAAVIVGLGWVVSPIISKLVNNIMSNLETDNANDLAEGLQEFKTTVLPQIQLTIKAAEDSAPYLKARLARWLPRLKIASLGVEAILNELEYQRLKEEAEGKATSSSMSALIKKASPPQKKMLLERFNELKEIASQFKTFCDLLGIQNTKNIHNAGNRPFVTSSLRSDKVFSHDGDCAKIINFLFNDGDRYSVVAVTGMGGAGKTLAQYVYNDERIEKRFGKKIWLSLSPKLDIIEHTMQMIESVSGTRPNLGSLEALHKKLLESLPESVNILVVLDDVCNDRLVGANNWENLLKPFNKFASRGGTCKIVVTSRSTSFPNALKPGKLIELSDLPPHDFKSLLRNCAIDGLQINNPQLKNDLSNIVDQIAEKICKLPLAAKLVGNQLRERPDITFWQATLEKVDLTDITEILLWSFPCFDVQLQLCFLFCSVFPKGTIYDLNSLVPYWVALDFIQPSDDNRTVEDIGLEYFKIMEANYIFHPVDKTQRWYIMHDLFHDLAKKLSTGDCFRVTNAKREIPSIVQHVYLEALNNENLKENLSSICNLSDLHTLIFEKPFIDDIGETILKISKSCKNLRVLDLWSWGYKTLPRAIGDFKNLRLLSFWKSSIEELPDSIMQLGHLQFLMLPSSVKTLPTNFSNNLIELQCIKMYNSYGRQVFTLPPIPYLGKLTSLQELPEFHVRKEEGYKLHQLGCLKEIGGSLRIVNLENVSKKDEAVEARLNDKLKLKKLELVWDESAEINGLEIEVIEALQPPPNLELFTIDGYRGSICPAWLQEDPFIENIKGVTFYNCNALTSIPPDFHKFRYCSELVLENLGALRELTTFSENLARLSIINCGALRELPTLPKNLAGLSIINCGALRELPTFPENLARLSIIKCPCLIFVCENNLQVNEKQSIMERQFLRRGVEGCKDILDHELNSFKQTGLVESCTEQLKIMENAALGDAPKLWVNVNKAWWHCHQQRMNVIFTRENKNKLKLPSMLRVLHLGYCCISNGALSDCLTGMVALEELYLSGIMTITTLPSAQVLESLQGLQVLEIKECWYLRSLGGLHALPHLERCLVLGCLCLEMESGYKPLPLTLEAKRCPPLPPTLQSFIINGCCIRSKQIV